MRGINRHLRLLVVGCLCLANNGLSQTPVLPDGPLSSPYRSVMTHLGNLQEDQYDLAKAAQTFDGSVLSEKEARELARMLKQVWDGTGTYIDVNRLPRDPNYRDTISGSQHLVVTDKYPEIYLSKKGQQWLYDPSCYSTIRQLHKQVYPIGSDWLANLMPRIGNRKFLGLHLWQYMGILFFVVAGFLIYWPSIFLFRMLLNKLLRRFDNHELAQQYIRRVAKPFSWIIVIVILLVLLPILQLPITSSRYVALALKTLLPVFFILVFYYLGDVLSMYLERLAQRTDSKMDDQLIPIARRIIKISVIVIGGLFILHNLEVNITTLLAGLSIGGLAFALAAQDTIKNFIGSVMIFIDRPFQIGDWITAEGIDGTVEEVGFRSTRIRTFGNSLVAVPNGRLSDLTINNYGLRMYRRFKTYLAITYDTPPEVIDTFVEGLKKLVEQHPQTRKDYYEIHLNEMGETSLNILFYVFFEVPTWTEELTARHEILLQVIKWAEELGVRFAFPTQTLHMETHPGQLPLTPVFNMSMEELKAKLEAYFVEPKTKDQ